MNEQPQFESLEPGLLVRAPAKLNLSLLIAGKRADGFHEIETVMAKIDYFDEILIQPGTPNNGIELICEGPQWAPDGPENLVYRAAELILKASKRNDDLRLVLKKNIPAGSGLGSASSDAAATLLGLNRYLNLHLDTTTLAHLASKLGSDVSFFLYGPLSICRGRGEIVQELTPFFPFSALVFLSPINVSTKRVYEHYTHSQALYKSLHNQIHAHIEKNRIDLVAKMCTNMLAGSCYSLESGLAAQKESLESNGVGPICLSGSGSAMFGIFDKGNHSQHVKSSEAIAQSLNYNTIDVRNVKW